MSVENSAQAKGRSARTVRPFAVIFLTLILLVSAATAVFAGKSTLGDYVWIDYNRNDIPDDGPTGINGVVVNVYKDDGNGIFSPTIDSLVAISTTINEPANVDGDNTNPGEAGYYDTSVNDGDHWVHLPASNFGPGGPLEGYTYTGSGLVLPDGSIVLLRNVPIQGDIDTADFGFIPYDWGDLPDDDATAGNDSPNSPAYNTNMTGTLGASHVITPGLKIGPSVDAETNGQPNATATGDDSARTPDDENGVTMPPMFVAGASATITISVVNTTSGNAMLYGFIDWNGDGDFLDSVEKLTVVVPPNTTQATFTYGVPVTATLTQQIGARFRLSTDTTLGADGPARDGEVEDYLIQVVGYDWGDLPDGVSPTSPDYHTDMTGIVGPSHLIDPDLRLGTLEDAEANGQPNGTATGDDVMTSDDEDAIATFPQFVAGSSTVITASVWNTTGVAATLYGFIDWNADGDFGDTGEQVSVPVPNGTNGNVPLNVTVPLTAAITSDLGARFRLSTEVMLGAYGPASDGEVEDYLIQVVSYDWGDLPDGISPTSPDYHTDMTGIVGPNHLIDTDLRLGAIEDAEIDGQPNGTATGDDVMTSDDEDAVTFPQFMAGASTAITVSAYNTTGVAATLYGFVDWNADGDFGDTGEQVSVPVPNGTNGNVPLNVTVPLTAAITSDLGARFRLSTQAGLGAYGPASDGEVEDYLIEVVSYDWGDLPDGISPTSPDYHTDMTGIVGPSHLIDPDLRLGAIEDAETDGQPNGTATGDDATTSDDEDAVTFPQFMAGTSTAITVSAYNTTGVAATLYGFIDWNADGDFGDTGEQVSVLVPNGTNGNIPVNVTVPLTASVTSDLGARFRLSTQAGLGAYGPASDGEVEDYLIQVERFDLALLKRAAPPSTVEPGKTVTFTIEIQNQGTLPAYNIQVRDHFTSAFVFTPAVALNAGWSAISATEVAKTIAGPLAAGAMTTTQLVLQVPSNYTITGYITNTAEISAADDDTNPGNTPPTDVDSTPDTNPTNDGPVTDNVTNNTNGDQDDHDPAPVLVTYNPTAVQIAKSTVQKVAGGMEVTWATESEFDLAGFNLYRLVNGKMELVNSSMLAAQKPGQADGASYQYTDSAASGQNTLYLLEIISTDGSKGYVALGSNAQVVKIFAPLILVKK